jgi:hypothetical protein
VKPIFPKNALTIDGFLFPWLQEDSLGFMHH